MVKSFCRRDLRAALLVMGALAGGCAGGAEAPFLLRPLAPAGEGVPPPPEAQVYRAPGLEVTARPVFWKEARNRYRGSGLVSPFGESEAVLSRLIIFSLRLENTSEMNLTFSSFRSSLRPSGGGRLRSLDHADIYIMSAGSADQEGRGRTFRQTCFDGEASVAAGFTLERYLVFTAPKGRVKTLELILDGIYLGATAHDVRFLFEASPAADEEGES